MREEKISKEELKKLLSESEGLALIKGKWVEIDKNNLSEVLEVSNGTWLKKLRETMGNPEIIRSSKPIGSFNATLRPYQQTGFSWLSYMQKLG